MPFVTIPEAIEDLRAGRVLVVVDDEDRENEGDLTIAAEKVTPETINFMATHGRGLICLTLTAERCDALRLPLMTPIIPRISARHFANRSTRATASPPGSRLRTARSTILIAIDPDTPGPAISRVPATFFRCARAMAECWCAPARPKRRWTWRACAGLTPAGVICEIMNEDGTMARVPQLEEFCSRHNSR